MTNNFKIDSQKVSKDDGASNKVWVDDKGIVNIQVAKAIIAEEAYALIDVAEKFLRNSQGKGKVLIHVFPYKGPFIATFEFRRTVSKKIKEIIKDPGFKKVAICGITTIIKIVSSFIITASGVKNMKVFGTKEEALKWLKK